MKREEADSAVGRAEAAVADAEAEARLGFRSFVICHNRSEISEKFQIN